MTGRGRQKDKTKDQITEDFHKEMADVFCHVLLLAKHHKINLEKEGVINFRCSMDMVHGRIEVQ